jgi:hypothetical protein
MSGAVAAHAAYNGSGTQGLAVTNKIQDQEGDVMSVFWNKNDTTRQLLHGSTVLEVPASGNNGNVSFGGSKIFTINNDIDCLGELYLNMKVTIKNNFDAVASTWATPINLNAAATLKVSPQNPKFEFKLGALTNIIERIEYQVGTQIWQTLEKDDVRVVYNTEMSEASYDTVSRRGRPSNVGSLYDTNGTAFQAASDFGIGEDVDVTFIIPALTKTLAPQLESFSNVSESGYPLAAAPHQSVKIKIYLAATDNVTITVPSAETVTLNEPSKFLVKDSPYLASVTYTGQLGDSTPDIGTLVLGAAPISLKSIKLYAKHLIMCNEERDQMKSMPLGLPERLKMTQNALITDVTSVTQKTIDLDHFSLYGSHLIISGNLGEGVYVKSAELKLNSSSFSGVLPAQMLDYAAASSLGLYVNRNIEGTQAEAVDGLGMLVFPLGSSAYSGSSVPLNRFDSIRLTLTFTTEPTNSSPYISITCIGETTALFKGGAASLAMY